MNEKDGWTMRHTETLEITEPYEVTPVLTPHARERCAQMGIRTRDAKRIWQHRRTTRSVPGRGERVMALSPEYPEYVVIVALEPDVGMSPDGRPLIVTVAFNCEDDYIREGTTYRVKETS